MLDGKILSAVLATLTAVAVSTTGGDISTQEIQTDPGQMDTDITGMIQNPLGQITEMVTTAPKPENEMKATLKAERLWSEPINVKDSRIDLQNRSRLRFGSKTIKSNEDVSLYGYTGKLNSDESSMEMKGNAKGVITSGVNISGSSRVDYETSAREVRISGVKESKIKLSEVTGSIEAEQTSTNINSPETLTINSFTGNMTIYPSNKTLELDGKVNRLKAGSFSFGE